MFPNCIKIISVETKRKKKLRPKSHFHMKLRSSSSRPSRKQCVFCERIWSRNVNSRRVVNGKPTLNCFVKYFL